MLIEAAKGGHVNVVNLLLDWPNNMSTTDVQQLSPPHSQLETVEVRSRSNDSTHNCSWILFIQAFFVLVLWNIRSDMSSLLVYLWLPHLIPTLETRWPARSMAN